MNQSEKRRRLLRLIKADRLLVAKCTMQGIQFFSRPDPVSRPFNPFEKRKAA